MQACDGGDCSVTPHQKLKFAASQHLSPNIAKDVNSKKMQDEASADVFPCVSLARHSTCSLPILDHDLSTVNINNKFELLSN